MMCCTLPKLMSKSFENAQSDNRRSTLIVSSTVCLLLSVLHVVDRLASSVESRTVLKLEHRSTTDVFDKHISPHILHSLIKATGFCPSAAKRYNSKLVPFGRI